MASITGFLSDAGLAPFSGRFPELQLIPDRPATTDAHVILTARVSAVVNDTTGAFTFSEVVASDVTIPAVKYTLRATWDAGQELDVITGLTVPTGDWYFTDLIVASTLANPGTVMYGFGPPPASLSGVLYVDISGTNPVLYAPSNGGI